MESLSNGQYTTYGSVEDLSSVLTIYRVASINGAANGTLRFVVILAAENSVPSSELTRTVDMGYKFAKDHDLILTLPSNCCLHGDADDSGTITISDIVRVIAYVFGGGPAPASECQGDFNCDCAVTISDAITGIIYIFGGGDPPETCCPNCVYDW